MKKCGLFFLLLILFLNPLMACSSVPRQISLGANTPYYGYIVRGEKFGVKIGDTRRDARSALAADGFRYDGAFGCNYSLNELFKCKNGENYDAYRVKNLTGDGSIYLKIEGDHVYAIIWDISALPRVDF